MLKDRLNDNVKRRIRRALSKLGLEVASYTGSFAEHRMTLMSSLGVRTAWDVGAHVGQYAETLRGNGFRGRIVSIEPQLQAHAQLAHAARHDGLWTVVHAAAGDVHEERLLHIAANGQSSSLLPMMSRHQVAEPRSAYVGTETTQVRRLDEIAGELVPPGPFSLKLDVQGYEMAVLSGATKVIGECLLAEVELSLAPLYDGGANWRHLVDAIADLGLHICDVDRVYYDRTSGDLLQIDGLFRRMHPAC